MNRDLIKRKMIYARPNSATYTSYLLEFPIGLKEVVSLIAIHWSIEAINWYGASSLVIGCLSENPNHELTPPLGVAEFMSDPALYGLCSWAGTLTQAGTEGRSLMIVPATQIIPLYGMLRPKRQVALIAQISGVALLGMRAEIYYEEARPPTDVVDSINRRYGKYRRS